MKEVFWRILLAMLVLTLPSATARAQVAGTCPVPRTPLHTMIPIPPGNGPVEQIALETIHRKLMDGSYRAIGFGDSNMGGWPEAMLSHATGRPTLNASVGAGTQALLWELEAFDFSHLKPEVVVLLVGANNLNLPACDVYWGIRTDVDAVHKKFPQATIIVVAILPRGENLMQADDKINEINRNLAQNAGTNYLYVPAHDAFICDHKTPCNLYQPGDNFHLNRDGFAILNRMLSDRLR